MRHPFFAAAIGGALAFASAAASADDADQEIIVTGRSLGYLGYDLVTATKTDTAILDVPQTLTVITRAQLDDQAHRSLGDVLRYVPGVSIGQGEGNRDQITLRGQNTTADFFLDGVRDDVQYFRPLYNLERVEVLKGPYALIFGRGGGGGIVNRVQKTPEANATFLSARASANSFGAADIAADANLPAGLRAALRLNGMYEWLDNHRDQFDGERWAINPYAAIDLGAGWRAGLSYEHVADDRVTDRGIPALAGTAAPLPGFRDRFFGVPGVNRTTLDADIIKLRLDAKPAAWLDWTSTLVYGDYDKLYSNVYPSGPANSPTGSVPLAGYTDPTTRQNFVAQTNLVAKVAPGGIEQTILVGLEYGDQRSNNARANAVLTPARIELLDPALPGVRFGPLVRDSSSKVEVVSIYLQDQAEIADWLQLVLGLRYDRFAITGVDRIAEPDRRFARTDEEVSPRLGVIIKPRADISLYGSYSQSFLPRSGDQFLALTATQANLAPESFTNYEIGAKWQARPQLLASLAVFQLDRTNATTPDPANPATSINIGQTRTKGFEAEIVGQPAPRWQLAAAYSYQEARLRGNDAVVLAQVPEHALSLWNRYDVTPRIGVGLGLIHQSSQFAAIRVNERTTRLPAFTRLDAALFFRASDRLRVQLNIENLTDETYFPDAHNNDNISTGAPITARLSLMGRF